jgi:hypothetical protein
MGKFRKTRAETGRGILYCGNFVKHSLAPKFESLQNLLDLYFDAFIFEELFFPMSKDHRTDLFVMDLLTPQ